MSENEKNQLTGANSECTRSKYVAVNPAHSSESSVSSDSGDKMDTAVANIGKEPDSSIESASIDEMPHGENLQVSEHQEVHTVPRSAQRAPRKCQEVFWEPLLVPSEVDGKVEMVTALKRVDSNYISGPRVTPKIVNIAKESKVSHSSKTKLQQSAVHSNISAKVISTKASVEQEIKRGVKKDITTKKKISDRNINEQIGKAIAEKEAAILKEIEKAMKEASNLKSKMLLPIPNVSSKSKSVVSGDLTKTKISPTIVPTQTDIIKNIADIQEPDTSVPDPPKEITDQPEEGKAKAGQLKSYLSTSKIDKVAVSRVQTIPVPTTLTSPALGSIGKERQAFSSGVTTSGRVIAIPTIDARAVAKATTKPAAKPATKEAQPMSTILLSNTDVQGFGNVVCGPATVFTSPMSTGPLPTKDTVNKLITVPVGTISNQQTLNEIPGIVFLASPTTTLAGGGLPLLAPIFPASGLPVVHTPVSSYSRTKARSSVKIHKTMKGAENKSKKEKNASELLPKSPEQEIVPKPANVNGAGSHVSETEHPATSLTDMQQKTEKHITTKPPVSSTYITPSSVDSTLPKQLTPIAIKASSVLSHDQNAGEKVTFLKSELIERLEKNEKLIKASLSPVQTKMTAEEKTGAKYSGMQQNVTSEKNSQKIDCNGDNMDVDDELISEELDQGFVDDTKSILGQNVLAARKGKNDSYAQDIRNNTKEQNYLKRASKKTLQKSTGHGTSEEMLESRIQRMEQLYNEIPPAKSRISLSDNDFSKIRDSFRDSMRVVKAVTASFTSLISQSSSFGSRKYVNSSCQTETNEESDSELVSSVDADDKLDNVESDLILCRLCGGFFKKDSMIFLFGMLSKKQNILSMLNTILPRTSVKESDGLPQQVCKACVDKLTLCHSIIRQFLQADKELRQVLQDEKQCASDSSNLEETLTQPSHISSDEDVRATAASKKALHSPPGESKDCASTNQRSSKESPKSSEPARVQPSTQKRSCPVVNSERSPADNGLNHKRKRRRSKSPPRSRSDLSAKSSAPSKSSGCIDLSRLDPEFNDGFEVEWCLDEETIRSSMVPEEDLGPLNGDSAITTVPVSAEGVRDSGKGLSAKLEIRGSSAILSGTLELHQTSSSQKKAKDKDSLGGETSILKDEVSKLSEMHTSVCESPEKFDLRQNPVSAVREERHDMQPNSGAPEKFKCPSCPLSFLSKQEVFLHEVIHHEEQITDDKQPPEQGSDSAVKAKKVPPNQIDSPGSKIGNESSEEPVMCDENSLNAPESIVHENLTDSPTSKKDSNTLECKVVSKEALEENLAYEEISQASLAEGKILVKCGNGMLWVKSSKFFSEEQMAAIQLSEESEVTFLNDQNDLLSIVSSEPSISNVSPQNIAKVQFAYKCDHCKQIFAGRSDLLNHMQSHLQEVSCRECTAKFPSVKALNNHLPSHIPPDHVCNECGLILLDSKKLLQHKKEHIHNFSHVCETCGKRFPNEQTLEVHEMVHYNKKGPLACSLCRKCFFFKHSLVRHRSQHASNRLQKCSLCFRVLNSSDQLRKHVALHHLMKNFVCFCKQTFPSQRELVEHRYLKHSYAEIFCARNKVEIVEPLPLHQCSICFRVLNSRQSLMKHHVASHSSAWPFYCIQCSRKYTSMLHLARHECHRRNMSANQCRICGKAFQNKDIFRQHKVIHDNRKWRYICRHCGKAYQKSQSLVAHIMTHGGKRFLCPRCHQPCQDKEGLLKHYNNGSCQLKGKSVQ